ncbi:MAG: Hsp20/alpha crystallin family protein [Thermomicrobiales bacterium]|nr:Hsp20/alpha crystallin family protein [Thermomicrobiales bacterium]
MAPWRPPVEVFETEGHLVVRAEIGGLVSEETTVRVEGDYLIIQGERRISRPHVPHVYHESRIRYGAFEVVTYLPFAVLASEATAEYQDGFLTVQLPRVSAEPVTAGARYQPAGAQRGGQ